MLHPAMRGSMMSADLHSDLLTIGEAARLLKVSTVTVQRWLKQGRLPAYRVGPRAVRIRRQDLAALLTPARRTEGEATPAQLQTTIRPLTKEEIQRGLETLKRSQELIAEMLAERGGVPFDESWPLIREERERRSERP